MPNLALPLWTRSCHMATGPLQCLAVGFNPQVERYRLPVQPETGPRGWSIRLWRQFPVIQKTEGSPAYHKRPKGGRLAIKAEGLAVNRNRPWE